MIRYSNLIIIRLYQLIIFVIFVLVKPNIKILTSVLLLIVVLFVSTPKSYIHSLLGHKHNVNHTSTSALEVSENDETQDCNFEKFDTPIYYTVFKFILNFLPIDVSKKSALIFKQKQIPNVFYTISFLRGPPTLS